MAKKALTAKGKLAGKTIAFVGKFGYGNRELGALKELAQREGGSVVDGEKQPPDILVEGEGKAGNPPSAVAKIQKKHPHIQPINEASFYQVVNPTAEEFLDIVLSGPHGHEFWNAMQDRLRRAGLVIDLSGTDFRNRTIEGTLYKVCLDDCDFRGAKITASFDKVNGAKFDGATMIGGSLSNAEACSLKKVTMNDVRWNPAVFVRCDFIGAKLNIRTGSYTTANECIFKKADLREADLDDSTFTRTDFSGAMLTDARLEKCDFTGANLSGADLSRADLRNAKLVNADLRKTIFKGTLLSGADLTGAVIDGADFTDANLTAANLTGLDLSKAKNLQPRPQRTPGQNMREFAKVASASKRFRTSIVLDLGEDEDVTIDASFQKYAHAAYPGAGYSHRRGNHTFGTSLEAPTFEQGMLNLVDRWSSGKPRIESIEVKATGCSMRSNELKRLAILAWCEAVGVEIPTDDQMEQRKSAAGSLRERMLAELRKGSDGVETWNNLCEHERREIGKLRRQDFSNAELNGVVFASSDLQGSRFDGATLLLARLGGSQLQNTNFSGAILGGALLCGTKSSDANFERALIIGCNLRAANFLRCNFREADLTNSDFCFSDLRGADFTKAVLDGTDFSRAKFDEKTVFPVGFKPPDELIWKGAGPRPGTAKIPKIKRGSLDFAAFVQKLSNTLHASKLSKATSMLKAERFQLFAEVKPDSLVGVVKSQTSKDLVYSCRLAADGHFSCCTQNLKPCGGLQGSLCKHLLVLVIGLTKSGQLDAATVDNWINASKSKKPAIDKDIMSETLLRYKGAEAGEVDWRPTETIPEDYYAL